MPVVDTNGTEILPGDLIAYYSWKLGKIVTAKVEVVRSHAYGNGLTVRLTRIHNSYDAAVIGLTRPQSTLIVEPVTDKPRLAGVR